MAVIKKGLIVFIDGRCSLCQNYKQLLIRLDNNDEILVKDFRKDVLPQGISLLKAERQIAAIDQEGVVYYGFDTLVTAAKYLRWGWFVRPFLLFARRIKIGPWLYKIIARNRILTPTCETGECR